MTTVLHASSSADFLRIVPSLAGFTPRESLVLVPFHATRTTGAMRLDLPRGEVDLSEYADTAVALVARVERTDAVAVVVYTDDDAQVTRDGVVLPFAVEVDVVLGCAADAGLDIVDALCVIPSGWSSYLVDEPELEEFDHESPPPVLGIGDVSGDQCAGADLPATDFAERERVGRALLRISELLDRDTAPTARDDPQALAAVLLLDDVPVFFEAVLAMREELPTFATAALLWCLDRPLLRDVAITQWATDVVGGVRTLDAQLEFADDRTAVPDDLGEVFLGRGPRPDPDRLEQALTVVRAAATRAPRASRPGPLTAAAWLSWALGRSSHAGRYLDMVGEIDPEYSLAQLLATMIGAAVLPEWAFRRGESAA
ncbi:DUF4192 family protein [Microbacterium hydrocarbonoxydans]|uniref:DUF4192 family protein n=1 Tax=Microbacterium hydrocarbonoxydans TaxID=273678 RepID=UPI00203CC840|nr:DUF4192 family protein [Microbacterium hydrocarbonoxydans]MCM3778077.1 DUF4192 domain-containing protein [Microbacterium hydrocarbonoxydans]